MFALKKLTFEAVVGIALLLLALVMVLSILGSAQGRDDSARSPLRIIEYKNDSSTVKVVYDHRHIANLDRNVTELQTKLGSAGWVPTGEWFAMANAVPKGCIIRIIVSEKESDTVQSKYALEGCNPGMSFASITLSKHSRFCFVGFSDERGNCSVVAKKG